jgi:DNA polymerase I-like protein with 3'-5' exonuclease and polymerase domains
MDIVTIDFETYYDKTYSLSKMTTESYIRDPRFEIIGVGVKINNYATDWYSGENFGRVLTGLDYSDKAILAHNAAFDGAILSWKFGIKPKLWLDTLSMARAKVGLIQSISLANLVNAFGLGAKGVEVVNALGKRRAEFTPNELSKYGDYCINDVELTYKLFKVLAKDYPASELAAIDAALRLYTEPVIELDRERLATHLSTVRDHKANLLSMLAEQGVTQEDLMSNQKLAHLLLDLGVEPPTKVSPTTNENTFAFSKTDLEFTDLLNHENLTVQNVVAARLGVKSTLDETRTEALLGVQERGPLPVMLHYYGAHTGRFSGGDKLNMQNLPRKGAIRRAMRAPEGHVFGVVDSSQIEARVLAWLASEDAIVDAFRNKRDVYSEFASKLYDRPITKADETERFLGKVCILGLGYGLGWVKLQLILASGAMGKKINLSKEQCQRIVNKYRETNHRIAGLWWQAGKALEMLDRNQSFVLANKFVCEDKSIRLPNGMSLQYPLLRHTKNGFGYCAMPNAFKAIMNARLAGEDMDDQPWKYIYGGKVIENLVQALATIIIKEQWIRINASKKYKVVMQVHDELVAIIPEKEAKEGLAYMMDIMSTPPAWAADLPVACEGATAKYYGDAK